MVGNGVVRCVCRLRPNHCRSSQEEGPGEGQPNIYSCRLKGDQLYGVTFKRGSVALILRFCLFWFSMWPATSQVFPAYSWQASFQARLGDLFLQTSNDLFTVTCSNVFVAFSLKFFSSSARSAQGSTPWQQLRSGWNYFGKKAKKNPKIFENISKIYFVNVNQRLHASQDERINA